jgi:hypothetical protein
MLNARLPAITLGLGLIVTGCSTSPSCPQNPYCHGSSVATCVLRDPICEHCQPQPETSEQPCPADRPACENLPTDISGVGGAACQSVHLDKSCGSAIKITAGADLVGDLNADGHVDFVSPGFYQVDLDSGETLGVSSYKVFLGAGDGSFRELAQRPSAGDLAALGDFNGDGKLDLAFNAMRWNGGTTTPGYEYRLWVAFGRGDGTFDGNAPVQQAGDHFRIFTTADVNGDRVDDLIGFNDDVVDRAIVVVLGSRNQFVALPQHFDACPGCLPIAPGDFNGDGYADLLVGGSGQVGVVRGGPDGRFTSLPGSFHTAAWTSNAWSGKYPSLALAQDVDGDGRIDLVVPEGQGSAVQIGRGDGTFSAPVAVSALPYSAVVTFIGDENGDGLPDLFLYDNDARVLALRRGAGGGAFGAPLFYQPSPHTLRVAAVLDSGVAGHHDLLIDSLYGGVLVFPGRCEVSE